MKINKYCIRLNYLDEVLINLLLNYEHGIYK